MRSWWTQTFVGALAFGLMSSCASSGYLIREVPDSLDGVRSAIYAVSGKPRVISENRRTYFSPYFSRKKDDNFDSQKSPERLTARFTIVGDRRPYDVRVEVLIQERIEGRYEEVGVDESLSKQVAHDLKKEIEKSRDRVNLIDDFRAF